MFIPSKNVSRMKYKPANCRAAKNNIDVIRALLPNRVRCGKLNPEVASPPTVRIMLASPNTVPESVFRKSEEMPLKMYPEDTRAQSRKDIPRNEKPIFPVMVIPRVSL